MDKISLKGLKEFVEMELKNKDIKEAEEKAYLFIMDFFSIKSKGDYLIKKDKDIKDEFKLKANDFFEALEKLKSNTPLEYITNKRYIYNANIYVNESVLIPRYDTEIIIDEALKDIYKDIDKKKDKDKLDILDLCTGSGVIGINVYKCILEYIKEKNIDIDINMYLLDISKEALKIADINIKNNVEEKYIDNIHIIESNLFNNIDDIKFDYILSNPPYIKSGDIKLLDKDVLKEPLLALDGGRDGMKYYREILDEANMFLKDNGVIFFEIGYNQADDINMYIDKINKENLVSNFNNEKKDIYKYIVSKVVKDIEGRDRVLKINIKR